MELKLIIDTKGQRVLFAEGGKDFIDFLFGLLTLPIGKVITLLANKTSRVSYNSHRHSARVTCRCCSGWMSHFVKNYVPKPASTASAMAGVGFKEEYDDDYEEEDDDYYEEEDEYYYEEEDEDEYKDEDEAKEVAKYMVMDDLVVTPSCSATTIALLKKLNIDALEEKVVPIGRKESLKLLEHAYCSTVLTKVFLGEVSSSGCKTNKRPKKEGA